MIALPAGSHPKIKTERKGACLLFLDRASRGRSRRPTTRRARGGYSSSRGAYRVRSFRAEALDRGEPASLASRGRPRRSSRLFREADLGARGVFRAPRSRWGRTRRPPVAPRRPRRGAARETRPRRRRRERRSILRSSCRDRPRRPLARTRASPRASSPPPPWARSSFTGTWSPAPWRAPRSTPRCSRWTRSRRACRPRRRGQTTFLLPRSFGTPRRPRAPRRRR